MPSQAVQRISIRWLPEPAYEDTDTIALNVRGYFIDLRVTKETRTIQWSRAGERITLKTEPPTFRWTHIIDSLNLTVPDDAHFERLPNGDDLEIGTTPCPHKDGVRTDYEEVWRDVTTRGADSRPSWILQSKDGATFIGKVGHIYLAVHKASGVEFAARREDYESEHGIWKCAFESGNQAKVPKSSAVVTLADEEAQKSVDGDVVSIDGVDFVFRGVIQD
ncbi:hypothetical protein BDP81DRAFT_481840 [Colletotrichum phormii]|uniref:Protein HRI1 n=1 Tax=Colletotrichum phormii TaxID=359342 RepID=A0AAI9ZP15_9PEZI|nr:uncharacterized protein BDP81DRAFT_481840 [Colletotrichum phormii]KAK1635509.1 hypothetical protein BDP81DRAFT_481840 [Colletotrichum phormii]